MFKYIVKRILLSVLILFGVSLIIYFLVRMMPMSYLDSQYSTQISLGTMTQEQVDAFKEMYGLADNSFLGILKGYFKWAGNMLRLDLGNSFVHKQPVGKVIADHMWISFFIAFVAVILQFIYKFRMETFSFIFCKIFKNPFLGKKGRKIRVEVY